MMKENKILFSLVFTIIVGFYIFSQPQQNNKDAQEVLSINLLDNLLEGGLVDGETNSLIGNGIDIDSLGQEITNMGVGIDMTANGDLYSPSEDGDYSIAYFTYKGYHMMFMFKIINNNSKIVDVAYLKQNNSSEFFANGPIKINNDYFTWAGYAIVDKPFLTQSTSDIRAIFVPDITTGKIENLDFHTAELFNEAF